MSIPYRYLGELSERALLDECARRGLIAPREPDDDAVIVGGLEVDPVGCVATWRGVGVPLTGRETRVLYYLAKAAWQGRPAVRVSAICVRVWHADDEAARQCLRETIWRMRQKLPGLVVTNPGGTHRSGTYGLSLDQAKESAA